MHKQKNINFRELDDKELGNALKAGHKEAFDEIVRRYQGRVYAAAYRITGNREDALDVAQEALIKVYRRIHSWQPTGGLLSWILKLTTNHAIDYVRKLNRRPQKQLDINALATKMSTESERSEANSEFSVRAREIEDRVREVLIELSPTQRRVFILRHFEGFPLADIAKDMNCTVGSVKVHLFRSMRKVRELMKDKKFDL